MISLLTSKWVKVAVFLASLVPLAVLIWEALHGGLGANPVQFIEQTTGDWTLRFLIITLAISPLRKILGVPQLIRFRRMLGLYAFFYVCLHFCTYIGFDQMLDFGGMWKDVMKRRYITAGFTAFVLLIPLAVTSTAGWIRRLGGRRWQMLHRAIYISVVAGVIHYFWQVKSDFREPMQYAAIAGVLLAWRIGAWLYRRSLRGAAAKTPRETPVTAETI
jgi:methionine sulfoxide reductase heme-binding subunit